MEPQSTDESTSLTSQLKEWRASTRIRNHEAAGPLFDRIYGDLVKVAASVNFSKDIDPRELVNQLYLRWSVAELCEWESRKDFFNLAKVALRNLVIDRYRAARSFQNHEHLDEQLAQETAELQYIRFFDTLEAIRREMGTVYADLLTLKYLSTFTDEEKGRALGVSEATAKRYCSKADMELRKRMNLPARPKKNTKTSGK